MNSSRRSRDSTVPTPSRHVLAHSPRKRIVARISAFLGFVTLVDPLRPTTKQTIARGVAIKTLSGDNREVAAYIGSRIGLGARSTSLSWM
jgi:magnesium-transporting ATPase (P-type)